MAEVLQVVAGATFAETLTLTERDGTPTDLTGATITFLAKDRIDAPDSEAVLTASTAAGTIAVDSPASAGRLAFAVPAADTAALVPGRSYAWTLQVVLLGRVIRYPDAYQRGPGRLIVAASAVATTP